MTIWNSSGFQTSVAGTRPESSSLSNKLLGARQPNTTLRESSKFWRLKSVDSKLCLNWRVWNEIPVSTVLSWQNGKYVLIPICDHYHYIKLQLSTPTTGGQKKEGVKRRRCHCFSFRMVLKPRGGVWVVHMWELIRIDVTVSAMNHTGCDWAEFEWWINCWNRVTRQSCKECWVTLRCIWASKCSFNCIVNAVTVIECESFIAIVMLSVTVTVLEIFVCCKQRGCLKLAGN